jgi:collagenase-like PrtC family protease
MKIQVGIGTAEEFRYYLDKDIDEFYAGISFLPSHLYGGKNFGSYDEIIKIIDLAHKKDKKFYLALNEVISFDLNKLIKELVELDRKVDIDGFIVRDIALIKRLKNTRFSSKKELILSTLALCFNTQSLNFYQRLGITRICLPEHITALEAKNLIKNRLNIDVEMFVTALEFCLVLNNFCYLYSIKNKCICREGFRKKDSSPYPLPRFTLEEHFSNLYDFFKFGVKIIKIGRGPDNLYSLFMFHEIKNLIDLFKKSKDKKDFVRKAVEIHTKYRSKVLPLIKDFKR